MPDNNTVLINKQWTSRDKAFIDIEDRGYQFGDGIYEVIRVYQGNIFMMKEHMQRLERSAQEMQLSLPYPIEELELKLRELVVQNLLQDGIIYLQISRGVAPRMHGFPAEDTPPQLVAYTKVMQRPVEQQKHGVSTTLTEDIRWLRCDIKSINLLGNVLCKEKATVRNTYEAILHRDQTVTEGSATNVFIIKDGLVRTHPASHLILSGVTRYRVLDICKKEGLVVHEEPFSVNELLHADEVFITSSVNEIVPVVLVDHTEIGHGKVGPLTKKLQESFDEAILKECGPIHTSK